MIKFIAEFLHRSITENLGIKLLSLGFAVGLFAFLRGQQDEHRTIPVGVVMRLPPEEGDRDLMTQIPASIHVTVRGSARALDRLVQNGIPPVEVDLRDGHKDRIVFNEKMFTFDPEVRITFIDPPSIDLTWEDVKVRPIPVQISITGQPADGFVVKGRPEADPTQVSVRGPVSAIEVLQFARLAPFDVSGLTEGMHRRRIALDPAPLRVRYLGSPAVMVSLNIVRRTSEVKFKSRPVEVIGRASTNVIPHAVDVTVVGPPEVVSALRSEQIVPRADLSQVEDADLKGHGSTVLKVTVELAHAETEIQPPNVTVKW